MKTVCFNVEDYSDTFYKSDKFNIYKISEYISWIEMEYDTQEEMCVRLNDDKNVYLHFIYNIKDTIKLTSMGSKKIKHLTSFQSAMLHEKKGLSTNIYLNNNSTFQVAVVQMKKFSSSGETNEFFTRFEDVFKKMSAESYFKHTGLPNLELGEYVKKLMDMTKSEISDKIMASGYINILLSLKLKQFVAFKNKPKSVSGLSQRELKCIKIVSEMVMAEPHNYYSVDDLGLEVGISANKLQQVIKEMHGRTVCDFIRHTRLLKAEEMLKNTNLTISEIVYSVGWTSRSYFSKIFKEHYNCTPKAYQEKTMNGNY